MLLVFKLPLLYCKNDHFCSTDCRISRLWGSLLFDFSRSTWIRWRSYLWNIRSTNRHFIAGPFYFSLLIELFIVMISHSTQNRKKTASQKIFSQLHYFRKKYFSDSDSVHRSLCSQCNDHHQNVRREKGSGKNDFELTSVDYTSILISPSVCFLTR